ncbi:MAG: hypothetical protein IT578_04025 [Verrucomicrobiae bacterium]|nr:hypothetical protein [Verrucomicrobiae bacterium]
MSPAPPPAPLAGGRSTCGPRVWSVCALLALVVLFWPTFEALVGFGSRAFFLPFLNQVDVALPLSWMVRVAQDPGVGDLVLWEHRHSVGSPMALCLWWPLLYGRFLQAMGGIAAYWAVVYLLHVVWIRAAFGVVSELVGPSRRAWPVAALFVFSALPLAINVYHSKWHPALWGVTPIYENFRAFPSVAALAWTTVAVWRTLAACRAGGRGGFFAAGLWAGLTVYGRPFDWMVLVSFFSLAFLLALRRRGDATAPAGFPGSAGRWLLALSGAVLGALPFLVRYAAWSAGSRGVYEAQLARGVMEGKAPLHFLKYALLGALFTGGVGFLLRSAARRAGARPVASPSIRRFWVTLVAASFLPYFQFLPSGKTPSSFQYFFIYFSVPFAWLSLLAAAAACLPARVRAPRFAGVTLGLVVGLSAQLALLATPRWMVDRVAFDRSLQSVYDALRADGPDAVVLCPSIGRGSSQELTLRAGAWSFVPHPMMYSFGSLATNAELVERQLLAKLLLTGTVADLAPLFAEEGLPDYSAFYANAGASTHHWLDRLENCPARASFFFDPRGSREDFRVRKLAIPPSLLQQAQPFAWFGPEERAAFRRVSHLEGRPLAEILSAITQRYRLTHVLLTPEVPGMSVPVRSDFAAVFVKVAQAADGTSLWRLVPRG